MEVIEKIAKALGVAKRVLVDYNETPIDEEPKAIRSLQKRLKVIPKLPIDEQRYLAKTIDMLAQKYGVQ